MLKVTSPFADIVFPRIFEYPLKSVALIPNESVLFTVTFPSKVKSYNVDESYVEKFKL